MSVTIDGASYKTFETPRLILRPVQEMDANFIYRLFRSENWLKYIGERDVHSEEEARVYIREKIYPQLKKLGYGNYMVIRKADDARMGTCGLYDREGLEGIDIGFAFLPEFEGLGYAFEAAERIKKAGLEDFEIENITAITAKFNLRSQRLLERLGLRFTKHVTLPNETEEIMFYQLKD
ncbi:GNAT family N-acetyltransferase [Draconibacterium sp. IB214405]|uniref:GNAT family N-acetyltransferase n=1 Tax=Draconibacterium sp. IB214405 TaxID=3097352 RepID=UPI002A170E8E|nr:GNAT family N-acetyltransferase [Draconibacterium sp. IB214405]MDX8340529.1 GNAT family N-acetyltransferase [Draconibacterium sp. IB214405]